MEASLKSFQELPSLQVEDDDASTPVGLNDVQASTVSMGTENTRTAAVVTANNDSSLMLIPKDSPLILRRWISDGSQSDDNLSSAIERLTSAVREIESAGKDLQECAELNITQGKREVADMKQEHEICQQELMEYQDKCAKAGDYERELRQCYESEITQLEKDVAKLKVEKKEGDTAHTEELRSLKQQHTEETKDLHYTIQMQAKHCRELEIERQTRSEELEELRSNYAKKEQNVAELRERLATRERELQELGRTVKKKEHDVETIERDLQEQKAVEDETRLKSMLLEKEEMQEKLATCRGISDLVSQLPNVTNQAERDEITKQVITKLKDISKIPSARKTFSWR